MSVAIKTSLTDWNNLEAVGDRRLENKFMLCLLRLDSWPNLAEIREDLVDTMNHVCTLLEKRPMVGFLIARRLDLPVDKTYVLLNMLQSKGHVVPVRTELGGVQIINKKTTEGTDIHHVANDEKMIAGGGNDAIYKDKNSDDILAQLWRVMNTDIFGGSESNTQDSPNLANKKDSSDLLGQVRRVLETEISLKKRPNPDGLEASGMNFYQASVDKMTSDDASAFRRLWQVLNSEITLTMPPEKRL